MKSPAGQKGLDIFFQTKRMALFVICLMFISFVECKNVRKVRFYLRKYIKTIY